MFHFSADRLAGLDAMILKITTPTKVPTFIPNHPLHRIPLADKTPSSNLVCKSTTPRRTPSCPMLLHSLSPAGDLSTKLDAPLPVPSFRPLPPLPSAPSLQLPSFLNFSSQSLTSLVDPPPCPSLPASLLFQSPPLSVAPSCPVVVHETKNDNNAFVGPQWIPAFHHPNSPYVPWSSPVRRRILPPPSPLPPSPDCSASPFTRTGAVAPEPWASSTFSQAQPKSRKERLLSSWKNFKHTIRKGVKTVVSRLGKSRAFLRTTFSKDMPSTYGGTDATAMTYSSGPCDALASSDSATLATWLAERRDNALCTIDNAPKEMSVAEYELMGSWLNLRHCGGGWACGVRDCDLHSADGSPYSADEHPTGLRMAMPFDSADLHSVARRSPRAPAVPFPAGPFSASPRFHSLPQLFPDIHSTQEVKPVVSDRVKRCLTRGRELSMPGGWTFS